MIMKKILVFLLISVMAVSCYDDYILDYDFTGVYFPYQINVRTFVVGEGMEVEVGAALGGVRDNTFDRDVKYILDNNLITADVLAAMKGGPTHIKDYVSTLSQLLPMPASYYTLSNPNTIVIKKGWHNGTITVKADSAAFLADPATLNAQYVLPFYIYEADADTVLENKKTLVIGFRYENMLFGKYWHGGSALVNRPSKPDTTLTYYKVIPQPEAKVWILKTAGPNSLYANGYFDQATTKNEMLLTLNGDNITISSVPGASFAITGEGTSTFNRSKLLQERKLFLKYTYTNAGNGFTYHCTDTIYFRNRIRDGVNEWQDENPSNYN
jgi:hypothetical protein